MRIHTPSPKPRDDGEFEVRVNPGDGNYGPFAMIALSENSETEICLDDLDDARRLVRAAVKALRRLEASVKGEPHPYRGDACRCDTCGQTRAAAIHAAPAADPAYRLTAKGYVALGEGGVLFPAGCDPDAPVITDSERTCQQANPASGAWCHRSGPHAEHRDTDGETWPAACGARPYPAGSEGDDGTECVLPAGHDGPHDDEPASVTA